MPESYKWKVGDKIRMREDCGTIRKGEIGELNYSNQLTAWFNYHGCPHEDKWELVEDVAEQRDFTTIVFDEWNQSLITKAKTLLNHTKPINPLTQTFMNIVKFAKNLTLSADDKLLREMGLQDEQGVYTQDFWDMSDELDANRNKAEIVELAWKMAKAEGMKEEQKK